MVLKQSYVGRFAPTPSGPLHFGSIIAALASFLDARSQHGQWLLRIDDLDKPRVNQAATDSIIRTLERLGMEWDGAISYQSKRLDEYQDVLDKMIKNDLVFRCYCPRRITRGIAYPGTCRQAGIKAKERFSIRIITDNTPVCCHDLIQGEIQRNIQDQSGDFILLRSDKIFSYDFATAIDDSSEGITHVIRGADLLDSTPKQLYLQSLLELSSPIYGHVPIAVNRTGKKISKRTGAVDALLNKQPQRLLTEVLHFLGQDVDMSLANSEPRTVISWALENWDFKRVPGQESITAPDAH